MTPNNWSGRGTIFFSDYSCLRGGDSYPTFQTRHNPAGGTSQPVKMLLKRKATEKRGATEVPVACWRGASRKVEAKVGIPL
jgi:hypothetical protein